MEQKQLNFNAPLLSVRRLLSTKASSSSTKASPEEPKKPKTGKARPNRQHSLPIQKTDQELTEITKPVAVPFQWEKIPGRAKDESGPHHQPPKDSTTTPRLPPGRLSGNLTRVSGNLNRVSGEVPGDKKSDAANFKEHTALLESLANGIIGTDESGADSEDDDMYSDAHDTLSLPESFTWECNVSRLSGYDRIDAKPPRGTFLADPDTRDFIMSRFLPAAKAMVLEIPQYVSRKQNVGAELPAKPAKKFYSGELRPLRDQYGSNPILSYNKHVKSDDDDDDDEDDGVNDDVRKKRGKSCGFFPRLCVKNSLFLLNPVPGLKSRESMTALKPRESIPALKSKLHVSRPSSPAGEVRRMARTSYSGPLPQTREKHTSDPIYRKSSQLVAKTRNLLESENKLTMSQPSEAKTRNLHESENKLATSQPNESPNLIDSFRSDIPLGRPRGGRCISPYRNEAPRSPFHDGATFLGVPKNLDQANNFGSLIKACDNFLAVSSQKIPKGSDPVGPVAEKTLYVDSNVKSTSVTARRIPLDQELHCTSVKNEDLEDSKKDSLESSLPSLLPKSPSESWLWNTLPSISMRNPFSPTRKQGQKSPKAIGAKWETIVKTSNVRHDHVRYSEELVPHLSPHSKT